MRFGTRENARGGSSRIGNNGLDPWSNEETNVGKQKLELVHERDLMGGKWYPTANIPMYHMGDEKTIPAGPGVKKFETIEKGVRWIAFAPINPLSKTPINTNEILKIRADSKSFAIVPIVWRINVEAIEEYEKNEEAIGKKLNDKNKRYVQVDADSDMYSDDEGGEALLVGTPLEKEPVKKVEKSKKTLNIGIKYKNGTIKWYPWPSFVSFKNDDEINGEEKKQIKIALDMLQKSRSETWKVLEVFNG